MHKPAMTLRFFLQKQTAYTAKQPGQPQLLSSLLQCGCTLFFTYDLRDVRRRKTSGRQEKGEQRCALLPLSHPPHKVSFSNHFFPVQTEIAVNSPAVLPQEDVPYPAWLIRQN